MVWLMVAGIGRAAHDRPWSGGVMLGFAVWVKLLPLMGVAYLLLKRKWLAAGIALVWAAVVNLCCACPRSDGSGHGNYTSSGGKTKRREQRTDSWT